MMKKAGEAKTAEEAVAYMQKKLQKASKVEKQLARQLTEDAKKRKAGISMKTDCSKIKGKEAKARCNRHLSMASHLQAKIQHLKAALHHKNKNAHKAAAKSVKSAEKSAAHAKKQSTKLKKSILKKKAKKERKLAKKAKRKAKKAKKAK